MIKSVKVFPFSFLKNNNKKFFFFIRFTNPWPRHKHAKWPPSDLTPRTLTLLKCLKAHSKLFAKSSLNVPEREQVPEKC